MDHQAQVPQFQMHKTLTLVEHLLPHIEQWLGVLTLVEITVEQSAQELQQDGVRQDVGLWQQMEQRMGQITITGQPTYNMLYFKKRENTCQTHI